MVRLPMILRMQRPPAPSALEAAAGSEAQSASTRRCRRRSSSLTSGVPASVGSRRLIFTWSAAAAFALSPRPARSSFAARPPQPSLPRSSPRIVGPASSRGFGDLRAAASLPGFHRAPLFSGVVDDVRGGGGRSSLSMSTDAAATSSAADAEAEAEAVVPEQPKLSALRERMSSLGLDAYLVPSDDPHLSEYVPKAYMRRKFLSGFGGSAGTALVTAGGAYLWTDSRYFNEASLQLDPNHWTLMKMGQPNVPTIPKFLSEQALQKREGGSDSSPLGPYRVGMDPYVHSAKFAEDLYGAFEVAAAKVRPAPSSALSEGSESDSSSVEPSDVPLCLIDTLDSIGNPNLVDEIWEDEECAGDDGCRPPIPTSPFRVHPLEYAGKSVADKLEAVRSAMTGKGATLSVFGALDDVAYLLNVRAKGDVETCPVGIGYVTVTADEAVLHCDSRKVESDEVRAHLEEGGVMVRPYESVVSDVKNHLDEDGTTNKVWIDRSRSNYALSRIVTPKQLIDAQNAVTPMKACKNYAEMAGMRKAHMEDGAAMAHFMAWLEKTVVEEGRSVSEVEIDEKLTGMRAEREGFVEVSFPTIAGVGSNGAIIHYSAKEGSDLLKYMDKDTPILIDSGGQYTYGTTDVTRTWHLGSEPDPEFVDAYTRVLKGNIGVDAITFPENTPGFVLDVFARKALWEVGKDYGHGTGHGVGAALNVHEGPQSISPRWANTEVMKKGMVVSNEPGYYEDGNFGIRIENLLEVAFVDPVNDVEKGEGQPKRAPGQKTFLKFRKLTQIPIQTNLIDIELMTEEELDWLDAYHGEVWENISPLLEEGSCGRAWLEKACAPIDRSCGQ
mmetsp:Transcript_53185/g.159197  ORF Transcript_53185/g.159197 Transcript_53185/m.159197 type:complete len:838 (-) Transcript_53185:170-2683(-)